MLSSNIQFVTPSPSKRRLSRMRPYQPYLEIWETRRKKISRWKKKISANILSILHEPYQKCDIFIRESYTFARGTPEQRPRWCRRARAYLVAFSLDTMSSSRNSSRSRSSTDSLLLILLLIMLNPFRVFRAHGITTQADLMFVTISTPRVETTTN